MKLISRSLSLFVLLAALIFVASAPATNLTAETFDKLLEAQDTLLQHTLEAMLPDSLGYLVTGPIDPFYTGSNELVELCNSVRVICPDLNSQLAAETVLSSLDGLRFKKSKRYLEKPSSKEPVGYRGVLGTIEIGGKKRTVQILTFQQFRWLSWIRKTHVPTTPPSNKKELQRYSGAVSDYLYAVDRGTAESEPPRATDFGLASDFDIYPPSPDYVISGYENYKKYLFGHATITTDFARGILAFVPSDSTLREFVLDAPRETFPNKETPLFQSECKKYIERGGNLSEIRTLNAAAFRSLETGEYFFGVGLDGTIRFGRELLREEVDRIEKESGRKLPRANHAFLFPDEPLLTAGAFFIERDSIARLVEVNAQSGHYFYSNVSVSIREDIAERSDYYFTSLGHFFQALDRLGIPYSRVLISKL